MFQNSWENTCLIFFAIDPLFLAETGTVPPIPSLQDQFPTKINSQISDLKQISWAEYRSHKSTQWLINQQEVNEHDSVYRMTVTNGPGVINILNCFRAFKFTFLFVHTSHFLSPAARATALIAMKSNYPEAPPVFSVEVNWKGHHSAVDCDTIRVRFFCAFTYYFKFHSAQVLFC